MGEIAEMMLDGTLDSVTGEYIGESCGFPRTNEPGHYNTIKKSNKRLFKTYKNCKELNGIAKFLANYVNSDQEAVSLVRGYCESELDFIEGTLKQCAKEIQKDFGQFVQFINNQ
jgi:hypothetical protein